jgi:hypothetical protein
MQQVCRELRPGRDRCRPCEVWAAELPGEQEEGPMAPAFATDLSAPGGATPKACRITQSYHRVDGANILLYEPVEPGENAQILVASMHGGLGRTLEHAFMRQLAVFGFRSAFCVPDSASFPAQFVAMENCLSLLRSRTGVRTTVLMGQSRGAGLMSAFQKIAENGVGVYQGPDRRLPLPDMELTPTDGLMLLDANFGFMVMHMMSMNPALRDDTDAMTVDPALDALNPDNGYAPHGRAHYSDAFKHMFLMAQRDRYHRLLAEAELRWRRISKGKGNFSDNEPFVVADAIRTNKLDDPAPPGGSDVHRCSGSARHLQRAGHVEHPAHPAAVHAGREEGGAAPFAVQVRGRIRRQRSGGDDGGPVVGAAPDRALPGHPQVRDAGPRRDRDDAVARAPGEAGAAHSPHDGLGTGVLAHLLSPVPREAPSHGDRR